MTTKEKLSLIGFTDFIFPKKEMRDGKNRISFSSKYLDEWILLVLIEEGDIWKIEKIEDNKLISSVLNKNESLLSTEDIIFFFKNHYYINSDLSAIL